MTKIIDILPADEQKKERILHLIKRAEVLRKSLGEVLKELAQEIGMTVK